MTLDLLFKKAWYLLYEFTLLHYESWKVPAVFFKVNITIHFVCASLLWDSSCESHAVEIQDLECHMEEQHDTLERPPWPDLLAPFIKQLVLLRWERPPKCLAGFSLLFLSLISQCVTSPSWPSWRQNITWVHQTWNQKLN